MGRPSGHTLFTDALRVLGDALEAHQDEPRWRELVARTSGLPAPLTFGVEIYEPDPEHVVDHYLIRAHEGRFEVVEQGHREVPDWRVSADELRRIVAERDACIAAPERLDLHWLELRLGLAPRPAHESEWRMGRARRPAPHP